MLFLVTRAGLPSPTAADSASDLLGIAPRAAIASMLVLLAIAALALRGVNEARRED